MGSTPGHPIEIREHQKHFAVNGSVVIKGVTIPPNSGSDQLTAKITLPDGTQQIIYVTPDKDGNFRVLMPNVTQLGRYRMIIYGYRDASNRTEEFEVITPAKAVAAVKTRIESLARHSEEIVAGVRHHLSSRRPNADVTEASKQVDKVTELIKKIIEKNNKAAAALEHLQAALASEPRLQSSALEGFNELGQWEAETDDLDEQLKSAAARMREMPTTCDSLETAAEGLSLLSTVGNFMGSPITILKSLTLDKVLPAANNLRTDVSENTRFEVSEATKEIAAAYEGFGSFVSSLVGLAGDVSQFFAGRLFSNYCSVLEGSIESDFNVDQRVAGASWLKYRIVVKGKMRLWAEKNQPEGPNGVVYTGRIEGSTTRLEFFENIFLVEKPTAGANVFLRKKIMPTVLGNVANDPLGFGQVAHIVTPGHFNIRYKGALKDDKMALHQETVLDDFLSGYTNRLIIGILPQGGLIPIVKTFTFPIQKAAWMIDRTTKGDFILPVTRENDKMILKQTFTRDETLSGGESRVTFKVIYDLIG
ncbi:MAG: hypothetical protein IPI64_09735 [Chloracidobacterium sp.]|nr:hypothetical protein [Chloracidobacterium sp.]